MRGTAEGLQVVSFFAWAPELLMKVNRTMLDAVSL